jgi:hypothetical protein
MEEDLLSEIANKYATDKGTKIIHAGNHGPRLFFTTIYSKFFEQIRFDKLSILEIGIGSGTSLKMWYEYFPNATIHAIDVDNHSDKNNERVKTYICDQSNRQNLESLMQNIGDMDIIIDDGSHVVNHQQISLGVLFKYVKNGGQYWIEDLHTSDASVWNGKELYGYNMSFNPGESTVEVLENYIKNKEFNSPFLSNEENNKLTNQISDCLIYNLPLTKWGVNKLCLLKK